MGVELSEGASFLSVGSELPRAEGTIQSEGDRTQSAQVWGSWGCGMSGNHKAQHRCFS